MSCSEISPLPVSLDFFILFSLSRTLIISFINLVSRRGVVFFRKQNIEIEDQKLLAQRLGELTGKPETSKLHVHPLFNSSDNAPMNESGAQDPFGKQICG